MKCISPTGLPMLNAHDRFNQDYPDRYQVNKNKHRTIQSTRKCSSQETENPNIPTQQKDVVNSDKKKPPTSLTEKQDHKKVETSIESAEEAWPHNATGEHDFRFRIAYDATVILYSMLPDL